MKSVLLVTAILFSILTKAQSVIVEYKGTNIVLQTNGVKYSVGSTIEITRTQWGNTSKITPWVINNSPILGLNEVYSEKKDLEECKECVTGFVVMRQMYARVKVKK